MSHIRSGMKLALLLLFVPLYLAIGWFAWLTLDSSEPITVLEAAPVNYEVQRGNPAEFRWTLRKDRSCEGEFTRYLVDEDQRVTLLDLPPSPWLPAGEHSFVARITIPATLPPGVYRYVSAVVWRCSPLRTIPQTIATVQFRVTG